MKNLLGTMTGMAFALGLTTAAVAQTWEMPTPYPDATFHTVNINEFAADVAKATDGALKINVHSGGSLFQHKEIKSAIRGGQVQLGEMFLGIMTNENPVFGLDSLPFLATDFAQAMKLFELSRPAMNAELEKQGMMLLFAVPWPPQGLYSTKEIGTASDLAGMKFRATNSNTTRLANIAGAVPTQIEVSDLAQAFATGRIESMITSPSTGVSNKAWDFLSHYYDIQAWIPKNGVLVNKAAFDALDEATQTAVLEAAAAAEARGWAMSAAEAEAKMAILAENGVAVAAPSAELVSSLTVIGDTMKAEWLETAGEDGAAMMSAFEAE